MLPRPSIPALILGLCALAIACGEPPPPRVYGLDRVDAPAPRGYQYLGAFENLKSEPYAPITRPSSVALLADGTLFYSDLGSGRIHRFDPELEYVGSTDRPLPGFAPLDMVSLGLHVYVADRNAEKVFRFNADGAYRDLVLNVGALDKTMPIRLRAIDIDRDGRFALADEANHRVVVTGAFLDLEYTVGEYGRFLGQFSEPSGVCFGPSGFLYVADRGNRRVTVFDETGLALAATQGVDDPDPLMMAPSGMDADRFGNVYVCDTAMGVVHVLAPDLHPLAQVGGDEFAEDHLSRPVDCTVGPGDQLFVVDAGRNALLVYQIVFP